MGCQPREAVAGDARGAPGTRPCGSGPVVGGNVRNRSGGDSPRGPLLGSFLPDSMAGLGGSREGRPALPWAVPGHNPSIPPLGGWHAFRECVGLVAQLASWLLL